MHQSSIFTRLLYLLCARCRHEKIQFKISPQINGINVVFKFYMSSTRKEKKEKKKKKKSLMTI